MKKILVTGSLGYIGSVLVPYLNKNNFDCIGYDTGFFRDCILYPPIEQKTIYKDVRDITKKDLKGINTLVHLAGISNDPFGNLSAEKVYTPTRVYSLKLAKMCKEMGIRFIFASSCSVYGKGDMYPLTEDSKTYPQTPYSINKLQIERDLIKISDNNFSPIILRFATVFGPSPRMRFDLFINMFAGMNITMNKIILNSNGEAWRPNIYILDVLKAIKYAIEYKFTEDKAVILNIGDSTNNFRIIDIAKIFTKIMQGSKVEFLSKEKDTTSIEQNELIRDKKIQDGVDKRTYQVSFERIKTVFKGFECDWTVKKGIESMIKIFKDLNLTEKEFKNINFYRLQKYEYLSKKNYISEDVSWKKILFKEIMYEKNNNKQSLP